MPPRYVYWTILIDNKPTAFRAHKQEELLPTFNQLRRTNPVIALKWYAHGRLWDSPEQAEWARRNKPVAQEKRGHDWRPGGRHEDPRKRFARGRSKPSSPRSTDRPSRRPPKTRR